MEQQIKKQRAEFEYPPELTFSVSGRYFDDIATGVKKFEGRGKDSRLLKTTKATDIIKIVHPETNRYFLAWRGSAFAHNSIEEMLLCAKHPISVMLPGTESIAEGVQLYQKMCPEMCTGIVYAIEILPCSRVYPTK
jgi:ASC-1-like (ASCH) protein